MSNPTENLPVADPFVEDVGLPVVGHWIGAEVGLFASAPLGADLGPGDGGTFGPVRVTVAGKEA